MSECQRTALVQASSWLGLPLKRRLRVGAAIALAAAGQPLQAAAPVTPAMSASSLPSAARVLSNIRQAVGYARLQAFGRGFVITERGEDGHVSELLFGTRLGEVRRGDEFGYDGLLAWQHDGRRSMAVPAPVRQRDKLAWPLWVRGHWWLRPGNDVVARVSPEQSSSTEIALTLSRPDGVVDATIFVSKKTWLPARLVVPYERGPYTATFSDYRAVRGVLFPARVEASYRDVTRHQLVAVSPLPAPTSFHRPPPPGDFRFGDGPSALTTRQGVPFSSGTPGHVYVRGSVNDLAGWWHVDSGSDSMIIDEEVAKGLKLEVIGTHRSSGADGNVREGTWRRARNFRLGPITIENLVFRAMDLSQNNAPPGERRMGTIGYDLFARSIVEYGDGGRRVRICDPAIYRLPKGARWRTLQHIDSTAAFPGVADGHAGLFQIDTGSAGTVDFTKPFHERHGLLRDRTTQSRSSIGSGGTFAVEIGRLREFRFAGQRFQDLEVSFRTGGLSREGSAGTIGRTVLSRFTIVFDYSRQRLAFLPQAGAGQCGR